MISRLTLIPVIAAIALATGCNPTVKLEAPDKPIEINMNVKIQQDVRVRVDKDVDKAIAANPDLFGLK
ncbi:MAG: YnbE family lipoprotein [Pseudomonadota bacterium]